MLLLTRLFKFVRELYIFDTICKVMFLRSCIVTDLLLDKYRLQLARRSIPDFARYARAYYENIGK
jgi:hypothetical protein